MEPIVVIGAGLAGCEAAWQIAKRGGEIILYEMKPEAYSPAHRSPFFAELVCSNSFKSESIENASGVLKEEMGQLGSFILRVAKEVKGTQRLFFYDAISPIVTADSINYQHAFKSSRYGKGGEDYVNCPMDKEA